MSLGRVICGPASVVHQGKGNTDGSGCGMNQFLDLPKMAKNSGGEDVRSVFPFSSSSTAGLH